ncbi:hypothetical protein E4P41_05210 [Geodermatophilus sp. DF01-2]|uniref:hypothetical protein n=1 Tax=Geodermatophilus sp. DF01-2 TaxID=2559610 RepID=UPI001073B69F|nr:hypothetical protein [Geodermatophilus sp. DF01_2]TFV63258.1 hypothetical protein E4P41_05210 [Geodermatophilus sp. DF01_2]
MPTRHTRHRPRHRAEGRLGAVLGSRQGHVVVAVALVAVLTAAAVALFLGRDRADRSTADGGEPTREVTTPPTAGTPTAAPPDTDPSAGTDPVAPAPPAAALLDWAERELPVDSRLRAEAGVRDDLLAAGAPDDLLATDRPTGPGDLVLTVTDGEPTARSRVLARFGGLTVADPSPGIPTAEQLDRRRTLAEAVLANPTTRAPEEAAAVLRSADVDMRLLSLLAVLTAREGIGVAAFPRTEGDEGPARSVLLDAVGSAPVGTGEPATAPLRTWLEAQLPPFAPDHVEVTGDGVLLSYRYASDPDALVAEVSP